MGETENLDFHELWIFEHVYSSKNQLVLFLRHQDTSNNPTKSQNVGNRTFWKWWERWGQQNLRLFWEKGGSQKQMGFEDFTRRREPGKK